MSLRSIDISKVKRLSLKEVTLPAQEPKKELIYVEKPPTDEETAYSKMIEKNPYLEKLVNSFNLVSNTTGERLKKPICQPQQTKEPDRAKLKDLAERLIEVEKNYTKEDIIERIKETTNVNQDRAERGFNLMVENKILEEGSNRYYLTGSTPF